jgi:tetratricopeptide (TPR) repeat protein
MEARQVAALLEQAARCRQAHNWSGAIDLLKRALTIDPEHPSAHASLALALLGARRLYAASHEADLAVGLDPSSPFCHYAAAAVRLAERKLDDAWKHCLVAMQDDDENIDARVLGATIKARRNDNEAARMLLEEALAIDADHADALTELARLDLHAGKLGDARRRIELALSSDPSDSDAHIVAGYVALARSEVDEAEQHARFVLGEDASSRGALELWTAIKARKSLVMGLWWRWCVFTGLRSERGQLGIMIGSFITVQLLIIVLGATDNEDAQALVAKLWLAFCAYTWFAPTVFNWMLRRELKTVALRDDY